MSTEDSKKPKQKKQLPHLGGSYSSLGNIPACTRFAYTIPSVLIEFNTVVQELFMVHVILLSRSYSHKLKVRYIQSLLDYACIHPSFTRQRSEEESCFIRNSL